LGFALDAKQLGGEIFDVRRQRDQQLGLRGTRGWLRARRGKLVRQRMIGCLEVSDERAIEPDQAVALVQIGKGNAEAKLHEVRIIVEFFSALPYYSRERPMQIKNSVFLITGGASGLGAATARMAAENGGKVLIADMQAE